MKELLTSTSIALGEAYMDGKLEIEGDLYHALNMFLGQMGKFSTDKKALKKLIFLHLQRRTSRRKCLLIMTSGMIFTRCGLMRR